MLLFRDEEHVNAWLQREGLPKGAMLTLRQLWELAETWYGDRLSPEWRRRAPEEAEEIFSSIGLTGDFWRLTRPPG